LAEAEAPPSLLHSSLAEIYRERLNSLSQALDLWTDPMRANRLLT
jgi:hypothetical protein